MLEPTEIVQRLRRRPLQLSGGARDAHQRQQTIRSTIAWSYQLLTPLEQALLVRLPVFASLLRLDAIAEVLGDAVGDGLDDGLSGLVDKSLLHALVVEGGTRLRMLELVREFAAELLVDTDDVAAVRARHAAFYTAWVDDALRSAGPRPRTPRGPARSRRGEDNGRPLNQRYGHRSELPWVAIALAGALARMGRVADAAVLVASAEATAQRLGLRETAGDVPENERIRALISERARGDLDHWRARGRAMPLDEALRTALGDRPTSDRPRPTPSAN